MNRNGLYFLIGVLVIVVVGLGIYIYHEQTKPGIELKANEDGISIQKN